MRDINEMYIRRKNKIMFGTCFRTGEPISKDMIATGIKNLESYGYTFSEAVIEKFSTMTREDFMYYYNDIISIVKEHTGADKMVEPMYPNFPQEVMEMDEVELYLNAIIHYLTEGQYLPDTEKSERFPLVGNYNLTVIDLGSKEEFYSVFTNLLSSKVSISETDKNDIHWFIENVAHEVLTTLMPEEISFKEILSFITMELWDIADMREALIPYYKTATDVLRLATALSGGDESLSSPCKYKSFKRSERRVLLSMLENAGNIEEDMLRHKTKWIRLGEVLHPSEYKKFKKVNTAFYKLRNRIKIDTFGSKIERAYNEENLDDVLKLLKTRPGEFARRLDRTLRMAETREETNEIVKSFSEIAEKLPTPLLLQLQEYFNRRGKGDLDIRVFFPKGNVAKAYGKENDLKELDELTCRRIENICQLRLMNEYSKKDYLGKVYIDKELKNYIVPMSQRTASKTLKSIARGSRMKIKDGTKVLRHFIYWKQAEDERTDLDLSAVLYDENFERLTSVSYMRLRNETYGVYHSGDRVSADEGASEFIDVDIEKAKENGVRYIITSINSFTMIPFCELEDCFMGYMSRDNVDTGEVFEPKTVSNKSDITSNSMQVISTIIDLETLEVVWVDMPLSTAGGLNNVNSNANGLGYTLKSMLNICKPNLYDLMLLNVLARGEFVSTPEEADVVISLDGDVSPTDVDEIVSKYL